MPTSEPFDLLLENLRLENLDSMAEKFKTITKRLNTDFRNFPSNSDYSKLVGPVGRGTAIRTTNTVDMYIRLPGSLYDQYNALPDNGQLHLLVAVKDSLVKAYPDRAITIQDHTISIPFADMTFRVTPIVQLDDGDYVCPDSAQGGQWLPSTQLSEVEAINQANHTYKRQVKDLARIAHAWRETWQIPLSHLLLDTLIVHFLHTRAGEDSVSFHQQMADFLTYLAQLDPHQDTWPAIGSEQPLKKDGLFTAQAQESAQLVQQAIDLEAAGDSAQAAAAWKKIFGVYYP
ncbi:MAG: hypothetical protein LBT32_05485 [Peptococcaceae bacterium]|jgi:hypothetical protein|nr:hypothetical protein [Peptococcaceae bacterium]